VNGTTTMKTVLGPKHKLQIQEEYKMNQNLDEMYNQYCLDNYKKINGYDYFDDSYEDDTEDEGDDE